MAANTTGENTIALVKGLTWGTAEALGAGAVLLHGRYTLSTSRGEFEPSDVGFDLFVEEITKLEETVDITLTAELFFGTHATMLMAMVLGDDTVSETTTDEDDYAHLLDMTAKNLGLFTTMVATYGTGNTEVLEFPSVKWTRFKITHATNNVAIVEASGIADRMVTSSAVNDLADVEACSYQDFDDFDDRYTVFAGANVYFRANAASGDALDSGDNLQILNYEFEVVRELERDFPLRGANTRYTTEPAQLRRSTGTLRVQFHEINSAAIDLLSLWQNGTKMKAEIFFDGSQINSGVNRSFKFQFPKLEATGEAPTGFDLPNNNTRMRPGITFRLLRASAAPNGMTGVTNYMRAVAINERATAYV